jgi:hypothetical protein
MWLALLQWVLMSEGWSRGWLNVLLIKEVRVFVAISSDRGLFSIFTLNLIEFHRKFLPLNKVHNRIQFQRRRRCRAITALFQ